MKKAGTIFLLIICVFSLMGSRGCFIYWHEVNKNVNYYEDDSGIIEYEKRDPTTGVYYEAYKTDDGHYEFTKNGLMEMEQDHWQADMKEKYGNTWEKQVTIEDKHQLEVRKESHLTPIEKQYHRRDKALDDWERAMKDRYGKDWTRDITPADLDARDSMALNVVTDSTARQETRESLKDYRNDITELQDMYAEDKKEAKVAHQKRALKIYNPFGGNGQSGDGNGGGGGGGGGHP